MEGWLAKRKGDKRRWDRKFFSLTGDRMEYFTPRIKGNLQLTPKTVIECPEEERTTSAAGLYLHIHTYIY